MQETCRYGWTDDGNTGVITRGLSYGNSEASRGYPRVIKVVCLQTGIFDWHCHPPCTCSILLQYVGCSTLHSHSGQKGCPIPEFKRDREGTMLVDLPLSFLALSFRGNEEGEGKDPQSFSLLGPS